MQQDESRGCKTDVRGGLISDKHHRLSDGQSGGGGGRKNGSEHIKVKSTCAVWRL